MPWRTRASPGATRKVVPTSRSPRSRIRTGTAGCYRRSRRGFPDANGRRREHKPWTMATRAVSLLRETEERYRQHEKTRVERQRREERKMSDEINHDRRRFFSAV